MEMISTFPFHERALAGSSSLLESLNGYAQKCLIYGDLSSCQKAIMMTDDLQRKAGAIENYACQTFALGLGSDLLLSSLEGGRNKQAFEFLAQVQKSCSNVRE